MLVESPNTARGPVMTPTIDSVNSNKRSNLANSVGGDMQRASSEENSTKRNDSLDRSHSVASGGSQKKKPAHQVSIITPRLEANNYKTRVFQGQHTARERPTDGLKTAEGVQRTKTITSNREKLDYTKSVFDASLRLRGNLYMATMPPQRFFGKEALEHQRRSLVQRNPPPVLDHRAHR